MISPLEMQELHEARRARAADEPVGSLAAQGQQITAALDELLTRSWG